MRGIVGIIAGAARKARASSNQLAECARRRLPI